MWCVNAYLLNEVYYKAIKRFYDVQVRNAKRKVIKRFYDVQVRNAKEK